MSSRRWKVEGPGDGGGYEFARQLRARSGGRPVRLFAVSGHALPGDVARAAEAGFDGHVAKPPDPAEIERLLA